MKKYIMPTIKVAAINATAILAGSDKFGNTNDHLGANPDDGYEGGYSKDANFIEFVGED